MCGIIGQINFKSEITLLERNNLLEGLNILISRGPDNKDSYIKKKIILGHTRLAIIDPDQNSNQPMRDENLVITFNGEIYNFKELRKELIREGYYFKTNSDTEVILKSYRRWGEKCIEKFEGMWAFCISDLEKNKHFLSRDIIGEKPLVYFYNKNKFLFSSEIPSLLKLLNQKEKEINWNSLSNFNLYNFRHIPFPYTAYKNIFKLKPGYNIIINENKVIIKKYLKNKREEIKKPFCEFDNIMSEVINKSSFADVPTGVFLSGGVDSSLISTYMKDKNIGTYSIGINKKDEELQRAKKISEVIGLKNKQIFFEKKLKEVNLIEELKKIIIRYGEPINLFQIIYSNILLQEMKKEGIIVAIGGNGADELFYGYNGSNLQYIISYFKSKFWDKFNLNKLFRFKNIYFDLLNLKPCQSKIKIYENKIKKKKYLKDKYKKFIYNKEFSEICKEIESRELINIYNWLGVRIENEHSITIVSDLSSSINGMEIRSPFLNKKIIDFSNNLNIKYKIKSFFSKRKNKYILKKTLSKKIGKKYSFYKKLGFGYNINQDNFIKNNLKEIRTYFKDYIHKIPIYKEDIIDIMLKEHLKNNKKHKEELIEILLVCIWFEGYLKNE